MFLKNNKYQHPNCRQKSQQWNCFCTFLVFFLFIQPVKNTNWNYGNKQYCSKKIKDFVFISKKGKWMFTIIEIPDGKRNKKWYDYKYDRENPATIFVFFHFKRFLKIKNRTFLYSFLIITDFVFELHAEKYPNEPFEMLEIGFAGAAEPGLLFTSSRNVLKYS